MSKQATGRAMKRGALLTETAATGAATCAALSSRSSLTPATLPPPRWRPGSLNVTPSRRDATPLREPRPSADQRSGPKDP
jgi:hypothetical protein